MYRILKTEIYLHKCLYVRCHCHFDCNKTENFVFQDTEHRHYQGMNYVQNFIRCYGTCVNSITFTPIKKAWLSGPTERKHTNAQKHYAHISCTKYHPHRKTNMEGCGKSLIMPFQASIVFIVPIFTKLAITQ